MHTWARRIRLDVSATPRGTRLIVLNAPNGAGPGVIRFGSRDCFVQWRIQDVSDRVALPYRQQTGVVSCWEYYMSDGGTATAELVDFAFGHYNEFGIQENLPLTPEVWATWYPLDSIEPRQSQFAIYSGAAGLGMQLRTVNNGATGPDVAPVGFCRFATVNTFEPCGVEVLYIAPLGQAVYVDTIATPQNRTAVSTGAWSHIRITNTGQVATNWSVIWDRIPEGGGS